MKLWMRIATPLTLVLSSGIALQAQAQYMMMNPNYGSGMPYQQCPYNETVGEGASSYLEDIKQGNKDLAEAKKQLAEKKRAISKLENRDLKRNRQDIDRVITADYTDILYEHMDNGYACEDYRGGKAPENTIAEGAEGSKPITKKEQEVAEKGKHPYKPYDVTVWYYNVCGDKAGSIKATACSEESSREEGVNRSQVDACKKALGDYRKNKNTASKLAKEIEVLERDIENYKDAIQTAKEDYREEQRERTEGGVCTEGCDEYSNSGRSYKPDYLASGVNLAVGGVAMALGYSLEKQAMNHYAKAGLPSQPGGAMYAALGYGAPFLMNGLYGALGGQMGGGVFGCAGGLGGIGGGMFGNPYGIGGNMLGGGMFLPGMNGMINPYALGGGYPMGIMLGGMAGGMMPGAYMGGMMPGAYMGGMMPGAFVGGMIGAMAGGMMPGAYMGGMMPGAYMGGMAGGMIGAMAGGMMPGAYMGGMMPGAYMGGMMPGAFMGGMAGGMMPGAYMGGMMPGAYMGGMMPGAYIGGMGGGMMGMPMMGSMTMDGGMAQMQMYQQMQQMQAQQYQMYMQQQQQKAQVYAGLQSEMQGLLMRMQQVQMGIGIGGSVGIGIGGGLGNGVIGNPGFGGGTITGPGGSITGPGIINGNGGGNYFPPGNGNINVGPYPVNNGPGAGPSSR